MVHYQIFSLNLKIIFHIVNIEFFSFKKKERKKEVLFNTTDKKKKTHAFSP